MDFVADAVGRAPGRVNLIGEHTDYNAGLCLPFALPQTTTAAVTARADDVVAVTSADTGTWQGTLADLAPGAVDGWASYVCGVLWALQEDGWPLPGMSIALESTVPLGAGLSSSAALECSVAVGVAGLLGRPVDGPAARRLAELCRRAETEYVGAPTGGLDQLASMLGQEEHALLLDFADGSARPVPLPLREAGLLVLVTDTGTAHRLADADGGYGERRAQCEQAAAALGLRTLREADADAVRRLDDPTLQARARHVVTENARVRDAVAALEDADWAGLGRLLDASHASLRDDFAVSTDELDLSARAATAAGALGARLTGGGFGGSTIALVPADRADDVRRAVDDAFAGAGLDRPRHLAVRPSAGARLG